MKFSLEATNANQIISYDDNQVIISPEKQTYSIQLGSSLIVTPDQIISPAKITDISKLSEEDISYLHTLEPEIIIFTAGPIIPRPKAEIIARLAKKSIGVESMTLGSACRTYNLLALEDRRVMLVISLI
ncbi:MAG: hypothetical protein COA63_013370 [Methylophaga sp.]|nr:hypothetical protein [Methylophaga sp.]